MNIVEALDHPELFGPHFAGRSWDAWRAFLKATHGLPLSAKERKLYREATGRKKAPRKAAREVYAICGRRGGKTRVTGTIAVYTAALVDHSAVLAPGEQPVFMVLAADRRQAGVAIRYIKGLVHEVPALQARVTDETKESITLGRVKIEVHTSSFRTVRGYTIVGAICDEVAFWRDDASANPDEEVFAALRPAMASVPGATLYAISSPYARRGVLWDAYREHHGPDGDPDVLVWKAPTRLMNPSIPQSEVDKAMRRDPERARAEYLAEFRRDVDGFVSREVVEACTVAGRKELPFVRGPRYRGFVDPSGGSKDAMTLAIAHLEGDVAVLDCVRVRKPPFSPDAVAKEFAETLRSYGLRRVKGDRYGGEWPRERFSAHGVTYVPSKKTKSDIYGELLPLLNAERCALLDHRLTCGQLINLERRTARGGRDSIDHPPGGHDDAINAAAGALVDVARVARRSNLSEAEDGFEVNPGQSYWDMEAA